MKVLKTFPEELLHCKTHEVHKYLKNLSLFHLKGEKKEKPLFVSTLLHGNETTGFYALVKFFKKWGKKPFPRDLIILLGNVDAAKEGVRFLDGQPDFNRIWDSSKALDKALNILDYLKGFSLLASIDLHNATGKGPAYVAVNSLKKRSLALGLYLSSRIVYFNKPSTALSVAMTKHCPSVTFEAGLSGSSEMESRVCDFIEGLLTASDDVLHETEKTETTVFHSLARIFIPKDASFTFFKSDSDFNLDANIDEYNFREVLPGSSFGTYNSLKKLIVLNESNEDIGDEYFEYRDGTILTKKSFIPSLLSVDHKVVLQDSLGYIMNEEKVNLK